MAFAQLFVWFSLVSFTIAATVSTDTFDLTNCNPVSGEGCPTEAVPDCQQICGCDESVHFLYAVLMEQARSPPDVKRYTLAITDAVRQKLILRYDEIKEDCVLNVTFKRGEVIYYNADDDDGGDSIEGDIAKIHGDNVDKVFKGILISAVFFIVCASVCVLSICIFCFHIRRSDRMLKNDVNALAKKLKIDLNKKDSAPLVKKKQRNQEEESCNVVVPDTNIMCV